MNFEKKQIDCNTKCPQKPLYPNDFSPLMLNISRRLNPKISSALHRRIPLSLPFYPDNEWLVRKDQLL